MIFAREMLLRSAERVRLLFFHLEAPHESVFPFSPPTFRATASGRHIAPEKVSA